MVSPIGVGSGFNNNTCTSMTVSLGIGKSLVPSGTFSHPSFTQCRIYAHVLEMAPQVEEKYFQMVPTKTIKYNDILSFQITNIASQANFSQIITNGCSRLRYLLIAPIYSSTANGIANNYLDPMNSPFSSAPGTCCPYAFVNNFNVLISGTAIYQSNYNYRFEHFLQEIRQSEGLNGGVSIGLSSGMIGQSDYENGYGFIYVDLSRKTNQGSDDISRSIQVIGTNNSSVPITYQVIVGYEREITLSTSTGSLVI
jgi:hypothetical protein